METAIEARLARLERQVAELQANAPKKTPWWALPQEPMDEAMQQAHREMEAYGRYFGKTGKQAPDDWKPGDPIPDPDWWDAEEPQP